MKKNTYLTMCCVAYYLVICLVGVCTPFMFAPGSFAPMFAKVAVALPPIYWLLADAKNRFCFPHVFQPVLLSYWGLVVPVYLLWTRKWWGLLYVILHVVGTLVVSDLAYELSAKFLWPLIFPWRSI